MSHTQIDPSSPRPAKAPPGLQPRVFIIAGVGTALILALVLTTALRAGRASPPATPEATRAIPVRISVAEPGISTFGRTATGTLLPTREVRVGFPVAGVVTSVAVREGDPVETGQVLATLDSVPYRAAAKQARSRTQFLRARIERSRTLAESGAVAEEELEADEAELAAAEAELERAEWNWERTTLRAPFPGDVRLDRIDLGQVLEAGDPAFDLISVDSLEITVSVAVSDLSRIDLHEPVEVRSLDLPTGWIEGRVLHRPVSGDPRTSAVPIRIRVANAERALLAGTVAEVRFGATRSREFPVVPVSALRVRQDGPILYVLDGDHVAARGVETGTVRDQHVEILSGLRAGDRVVTEPPDRLRDGDQVEIATEG